MGKQSEEIDIFEIIGLCCKWLKKHIIEPLAFLIKFAFKKWWVGLIAIVIGVALSVTYYKNKPIYRSYVVFINNICSSNDFITETKLLAGTNETYKSQALGLTPEECSNITKIMPHVLAYKDTMSGTYSIDFKDELVKSNKSVILGNMFCIETQANDTAVLKKLQTAYQNYFDNIPYFKKQILKKIDFVNANLETSISESMKLDSMRSHSRSDDVMFGMTKNGQTLSSLISPATYTNEMLKLSDIASNAKNTLKYETEVVSVFSEMKIDKEPKNHFKKTFLIFVCLSLVLAYSVSLCVCYRKTIAKKLDMQN